MQLKTLIRHIFKYDNNKKTIIILSLGSFIALKLRMNIFLENHLFFLAKSKNLII